MYNSVYRGIDPIMDDLIRTIQDQQAEIAVLKMNGSAISMVHPYMTKPLADWRGMDFYDFFTSEHVRHYGESPLVVFRDERYVGARITAFLLTKGCTPELYRDFVLYLVYDDPWVQNGALPDVQHLFNRKVFNLFLMRKQQGRVPARSGGASVRKRVNYDDPEIAQILDARADRMRNH